MKLSLLIIAQSIDQRKKSPFEGIYGKNLHNVWISCLGQFKKDWVWKLKSL